MKRLLRSILNALTVLSLVVCLSGSILWYVSQSHEKLLGGEKLEVSGAVVRQTYKAHGWDFSGVFIISYARR